MSVVVRFAPSPTGYLHVGNARPALLNWLFARKAGGRFLLRFDDTDASRGTQEYADAIEQDLRWLGLNWDESFRQTDRMALYEAAAEKLKASGRLYPCFESEAELQAKRDYRMKRGQSPIYDRAMLKLTAEQKEKVEEHLRERIQEIGQFFQSLDGVNGEEREKKISDFRQKAQEKLASVLRATLKEDQSKRLHQLALQQEGADFTRP